jgi:hypothetical protein
MNETVIYLAGNISPDPQTYAWRDEAGVLLRAGSSRIRVIDPTDCKFNEEMRERIDDMSSLLSYVSEHPMDMGLLADKDFHFVLESNIVFANLALIYPEKPPIGTSAELAWAWRDNKPVIAIKGDNWYCMEPFIRRFVSAWVCSVKEGCELILRHWA